jgi:hypothetical protein
MVNNIPTSMTCILFTQHVMDFVWFLQKQHSNVCNAVEAQFVGGNEVFKHYLNEW